MRLLLLSVLIAAGSLLLVLFSYVNRLYNEKGRFLIRGSKDNVDLFEEQIEPKLRITVEDAELTFPLLTEITVVVIALLTAAWNIGQPLQWGALLQAGLFVGVDVLVCAEIIPHILLAATTGAWLLHFPAILRAAILAVYPLVGISQFLRHFVKMGADEQPQSEEPSATENIEALMLAGEEEGLLESDDRKLIRSVVEFGDKTVRDVMTPRPEIFAVPVETTLAQFKQMLSQHRFSRIPVYQGSLDHIIGFVFTRDILPMPERELSQSSVRKLLRPITFVPETKSVAELLKELQKKAQIAIVVDEYGLVAGLVTVEDMVEEIVGEIRDEHEPSDVIQQGSNAFLVPGSLDLDRLQELFGVRVEDPGEATTVSGLVTGSMGRVPGPGEVLEQDGLIFQVVESNGRKILRLLIRPVESRETQVAAATPNETPSEQQARANRS
jgi:putative hemolysin